ncbi:MAG: NERD domain-containing protein, partial [Betaproteobacteria bacterium]|nr:NERD domain-containing protein [Betaproteobacteria bacterium]
MRTLDRLRQGLSDQYVIYHGVHWAKATESASVYGEIDFIILSPYGQLLAIEQKDGHVVIDGDDLLARYK